MSFILNIKIELCFAKTIPTAAAIQIRNQEWKRKELYF